MTWLLVAFALVTLLANDSMQMGHFPPIWAIKPDALEPGDIVITADHGWSRAGFRTETFGNLSHVIICSGAGMLMEPTEAGVLMQRVRDLSVTDRAHIRILRLTRRPNLRIVEKIIKSIESLVGKGRSRRVGQIPLRHNGYEPEDATFGSRVVLAGFRNSGIELLPGIDSGSVWPKDFVRSPILTDITAEAVRRRDVLVGMEDYETVQSVGSRYLRLLNANTT